MATEEATTTTTTTPAKAEQDKQKTKTLYIWGFDKSLRQDDVKDEFAKCSKVNRVTIIKDKATGTSKGFGYVDCETPEDATKAMKEMDGKVIGQNPVRIKYSFSDTPDWLKYLDSKGGLGERIPRGGGRGGFPDGGRGRGRGRGQMMRGRDSRHEDSRREYGRFGGGRDDYSEYDRRGVGEFETFNERRRPYDDIYEERRPLPAMSSAYERRPLDDPYDRRPYDDPYERRPVAAPRYERRLPAEEPHLERRPIPRDDPYERLPPRDDIYDARPLPRREIYEDRRDIYEDRRDLYRPSDREVYRDPISAREPRRSPELSRISAPPVMEYRPRSPVDRDPYYSAPLHKEDMRRGPGGSSLSEYRSYPVREPAGRASLYEGIPSKRAPLDSLAGRGSDPYMDPYVRVEPRM